MTHNYIAVEHPFHTEHIPIKLLRNADLPTSPVLVKIVSDELVITPIRRAMVE